MNDLTLARELKEYSKNAFDSLKALHGQFRKRIILLVSAALTLLISAYFLITDFDNSLYTGIPIAIISFASAYFALFRTPKPSIIKDGISSKAIPMILGYKNLNIEYEYKRKPYLKEFQKSNLYPHKLSSIEGRHFFSGISRNLPFIAWFVFANYREKVGESALSMQSSTSEMSGFNGFQVIVKNLGTPAGFAVIEQHDDTEELIKYYRADQKWHGLQCDDQKLKSKFRFFATNYHQIKYVPQNILNKVNQLHHISEHPIAFTIGNNHIYLNQFWPGEFIIYEFSKSFEDLIENLGKNIDNMLDLSEIMARP